MRNNNDDNLQFNELNWLIDKLFDKKCIHNYKLFDNEYPDQILVNEYINNMGISTHFDDFNAFGKSIVTLSLINPIYMTLQKPININNYCNKLYNNGNVRILLEPRSLFVMKNDCRYKWRHGITKHKLVFLPMNNDNNDNVSDDLKYLVRKNGYRRVSLTIRKLLNGRKKVIKNDVGWVDPQNRREIPITNHVNYHGNNLKWPIL